jgi:hypothetical protein
MQVERGIEVDEREILFCGAALIGLVKKAAIIGPGAEDCDLHGGAWVEFHAEPYRSSVRPGMAPAMRASPVPPATQNR